MINFWTITNLLKIDFALRKKITFYAPLTDNLDFMGIDPVTFVRPSTDWTALHRDGFLHGVGANVPRFQYWASNFEVPLGLAISATEVLTFAPENLLQDSNTLIWFQDRAPKSTPTNSNPFNSTSTYVGTLDVHISHVCKANAVLSNGEINTIQAALLDVPPQAIPLPPSEVFNIGTFVSETPSGGTGTVFTLSQNPNLNSLIVSWGGLFLKRVAAGPLELQYTANGIGNRTITLGSSVVAGQNLNCDYVSA